VSSILAPVKLGFQATSYALPDVRGSWICHNLAPDIPWFPLVMLADCIGISVLEISLS